MAVFGMSPPESLYTYLYARSSYCSWNVLVDACILFSRNVHLEKLEKLVSRLLMSPNFNRHDLQFALLILAHTKALERLPLRVLQHASTISWGKTLLNPSDNMGLHAIKMFKDAFSQHLLLDISKDSSC
ncbi:hypothetical protein BdWA1_002234 [Babesia duncani]|uniref:Uncharacterized protein n=1 Tax=Babesia duncani TaxID=323732 RepID=A0AAD9PLJ9_9APIC|nr:hypothetical protein BdWA1_002234 [Babesia duncani]